jgi:hypothetical protein
MAWINGSRIEGRNSVNSANTKTSFKSKAMESVCSMLHAITTLSRCQPKEHIPSVDSPHGAPNLARL